MKEKLFLKTPNGINVRRHNMPDGQVRFTIPAKTREGREFRKLVAITRNDKFFWIHSGFSS